MTEKSIYKEIKPKTDLKDFVHSFWMHHNNTNAVEKITIIPDSYFKMVITIKNNKIIKEINNSAFLTYAPAGFRDGINTRLTNIQRGKEYILMNEYGVYSFRYPKLFLRDKIEETGQYSFAFFGPKGNFKFKKGINVKEINLENGTLPSNIVITKEDISKPISLQIEFVGIAIETQFGNKYKEGETFLVKWKD